MIHFIYGDQSPLIKQRIKTITKEVLGTVDEMNFVKMDASETLIQDCVDEATYISLGYDQKVVVLENCYFLLSPRPKNKIDADQDFKKLIGYINNPNPSTELIITVDSKSINEKSEIVSLLKEKAKIHVASNPDKDTFRDYIKQYINKSLKAEIDNDAIIELASRVDGDINLFQNNAKKLVNYTNHITFDDVCLLVTKPLDDNIFQIYNYLITHRNDEAIRLYRDLIALNVEPVYLVSSLANQFRLLNEIVFLGKQGASPDDIASQLKINPKRAIVIKKQIYSMSEETIHKTLDDLYKLDLDIKSGQVDRYYAFELFLINFKAE